MKLQVVVEVMTRYAKTLPPPRIAVKPSPTRPSSSPPRIHAVRKRLTPEQIGQLAEDYRAGQSTNDLMRSTGLGRGTILNLLAEAGVAMRNQGVPKDQIKTVIRLYAEGLSCQTIAERYGCTAEPVRHLLIRSGVTLRKPWEGRSRHRRRRT